MVVASVSPANTAGADAAKPASLPLTVKRTEFAVDVGGANSIGGLRALWRGLLKTRSNAQLAALQPIIVIKEGGNGLGMQLRLAAGPLTDAAAAAKICATMIANQRPCETTVFDGQRLAIKAEQSSTAAETLSGKSDPEKSDSAKPELAKPDSGEVCFGKIDQVGWASAKLPETGDGRGATQGARTHYAVFVLQPAICPVAMARNKECHCNGLRHIFYVHRQNRKRMTRAGLSRVAFPIIFAQ